MLLINDVLLYGETRFRVLSRMNGGYVWIDLDSANALPEVITDTEVNEAIDAEAIKKVQDPFSYLAAILPELGSVAHELRDKRLSIIAELVERPDIFFKQGRNDLVKAVVERTGVAKKTVYAYLRQYWQRGCSPNSLLPDYNKSGAAGKKRTVTTTKLGRPRTTTPGTGISIDASIERLFRIVLDRHYFTENKHSLPFAHRRFEDMYAVACPDVAKSDYPTINQLRYFCEREYVQADRVKLRSNKIEYAKDVRPIQGTATSGVYGPGARYEIDATIADIYLLSDDRQTIIGRPTIYVVVDVFSRLVTGFYVGLESPSYAAAMLALVNAMMDKTQLCREYGFEISADDWPSIGLPDAILADRGELLGHQVEYLEKAFGVRIENAPPFRGDAKGIVERNFRTLQADFKPFAPGVVTDNITKKRGGKDYRLDATLTLKDFTKIIIASILHRNLSSVLIKYDRDADMPSNMAPIPINIWRWGIQHKSGSLRNAPEKVLRLTLLPRQSVTISDYGVQCFGAYYTSKELIASGWLHRTRQQRPEKLLAAYDPSNANHIYVFPNTDKADYWECSLSDRSRAFRDKTMWELWVMKSEQKVAIASAKLTERESKRSLEKIIEQTIENAEKQRPDQLAKSKAAAISRIHDGRKDALNQEREARRVKSSSSKNRAVKASVSYLHEKQEDGSFPTFLDDLFGEDS